MGGDGRPAAPNAGLCVFVGACAFGAFLCMCNNSCPVPLNLSLGYNGQLPKFEEKLSPRNSFEDN